jgi:hypothetical protein
MTTRRRVLLFGLLAGLLALGAGVWLLWPRTAITRENAAKIRDGMTLTEVEAILGGPATGQPTRSWITFPDPVGWKSRRHSDENPSFWWCTDEIHIGVTVTGNGQLTSCRCWNVRNESLLDNLRCRLGL